MDHKTGRFVDDQQMLVLENHPQRNVLRLIVSRLGLRDRNEKQLVAADFHSRVTQRLPCRFHGATAYQRLEAFA
jgi:hypothetical protein